MFIMLVRIYFTNVENHSVQYFHAKDFASVDAMVQAATARYHNILAADLQNAACVYNACYMIDNGGNILDHDVFDRRTDQIEEPAE